jgi:tetratricopeptide (TPR) repeat protein
MERGPRIAAWILLTTGFVFGAVQGQRIQQLREHEAFYRWVIAAASAVRLGDPLEPDKSPDVPEARDEELFAAFQAIADPELADLPVDPEEDMNAAGNPEPPLIRAVRQEEDWRVYRLAASPAAKELREQFKSFRQEGRLQTLGTQFTTASLYEEGGQAQGVGLTSLFFGFRKLAANFLWLQVDTFWHAGEVHRLVPLMRTCVTLDPQFVDAYLVGSWHLAYNLTAKLENTPEPEKVFDPKYGARVGPKERWYYVATDFLKDGIKKNPRDYRLYFDLGYSVYGDKLNDHERAVLYLKEARRHAHDRWVPRMLYRSMWLNGDYEDAIAGWESYLRDFPGNDVAQRFLRINQAYLRQARYLDATLCAYRARQVAEKFAADGNREEADKALAIASQMETLAQREREICVTMWETMYSQDNTDTIARGRLLYFDALELVEQGRVHEARAALDVARFEIPDFFYEASEMIIEMKQLAGIGLTVSERQQVIRMEEAAQYIEKKPRKMYLDCEYLDPYDDITLIEVLYEQSQSA